MIIKKINLIILVSFFVKLLFVFFFHEKNLTEEWQVLISNFQNFKSYSYYIFDSQDVPSSYMPPLYFFFIYLNKIISFNIINYLHLVFFIQVLLSTISVILFYQICKLFFEERLALIGAFIFSIFPLLIYSTSLISSATLQLFFYLLFFKLYLEIFLNKKKSKLFFLIIVSAFTLLLRGEFVIILLFSIFYLIYFNKSYLNYAIIILVFSTILISPYIVRNYINTGKPHIINSAGYALWKGNNQLSKVEGYGNPLHPDNRLYWPQVKEFDQLYKKLDDLKKDREYEVNRDRVFKTEAIENIISNKKKYLILYIKKILSFYFADTQSSLQNYYNPAHILPILLFATLSIPGIIIALIKRNNYRIFYMFLMLGLLTFLLSIFFILPRYKISIISFQILFSLFFIEYIIKNLNKKK